MTASPVALEPHALEAAKDVMRSGSGVLIMGAAFDETMAAAIRAYLAAIPLPADLEEWEKLAEGVPDGPWERAATHVFAPGESGANICSVGELRASTTVGYTELKLGSPDLNAAFAVAKWLRACSPDRILSLVRAAERARADAAEAARTQGGPNAR